MRTILLFAFALLSVVTNGQVTLNEMQSSNGSTLADGFGEFDDWVEIHNPTMDSVEIGGLVLKDQLDTWAIPTGDPSTLLPPGGYFLLWADDEEIQGPTHTNFKLASGGEFLGLYESDSVTVIDSVTIPALSLDVSYVNCTSGWLVSTIPTPLNTNNCTTGLSSEAIEPVLYSFKMLAGKRLELTLLDHFKVQKTVRLYSSDGTELINQALTDKITVLNLSGAKCNLFILTITAGNTIYSKKISVL